MEMQTNEPTRRRFLKAGTVAGIGSLAVPAGRTSLGEEFGEEAGAGPNERPGIGCIGMRYQGSVIADKARSHGDIVAICDVDRHVREQARAAFGSTPRIFEHYRDLLARDDVDVVTIGTPDHWHAAMVIDACLAGKDVYVEKPLTLTVEEGRRICEVVRETGRVVQVGSWQRSDHRFQLAAEMVRQGRLGTLERVDVVLGKNETGGPFQRAAPPPELNWDLWQGQTPDTPFMHERYHYTFRWWQEYSGGQMTDWGAHHLDIAQWAIGEQPRRVHGKARYPQARGGYNVPLAFEAEYHYPGGVVLTVRDSGRNGILFTGSHGRIFVNRGTLDGAPVERLRERPLPREQFQLYRHTSFQRPPRVGKLEAIVNHMGNFFDCVRTRRRPISDVASQHQSAATCHIGNISMRLGRPLEWDAEREAFVDDAEANALLRRERRNGFELG